MLLKYIYIQFFAILYFASIHAIVCAQTDFTGEEKVFMSGKFQHKFYKAKSYLAHNDVANALPLFKELWEMDSANANINYLLGICYTEERAITDKSIYHLEKAVNKIKMDYDPGSYEEELAPIFAWYYLTVAYCQNSKCKQAKKAQQKFHALYGLEKNDFYTNDAQSWVDKCKVKQLAAADSDEIASLSSTNNKNVKVLTKTVEYTTNTPLYGVQVGAFSKLVPKYYYDLKNVNAFMDTKGIIRYVIGNFTYVSQANSLLKMVWEAGYRDAFIVDVNSVRIGYRSGADKRKFTEEVVSIDNVSLKADRATTIRGKVDFRVQIGAFKDSIPVKLVQLYLMIDGIKENKQDELTVLTVGSFKTYEEAETRKDGLLKLGIPGAFIVAYNYNRKIPVKQAKNYLRKSGKDK